MKSYSYSLLPVERIFIYYAKAIDMSIGCESPFKKLTSFAYVWITMLSNHLSNQENKISQRITQSESLKKDLNKKGFTAVRILFNQSN